MEYVAKANPAKKEVVASLEVDFSKAEGIYFADFTGLSVAEVNELRGKFHEAGDVRYVVAKNTLTKLALSKDYESQMERVGEVLHGPTAIAIGLEDGIAPIKIISDFAKAAGKPRFKGGLLNGEFVDEQEIERLKDIPPVEVLYAQIVGGIANPLSSFVGVLNETVRSFLGVLDAIIEKKKAEEGAGA